MIELKRALAHRQAKKARLVRTRCLGVPVLYC